MALQPTTGFVNIGEIFVCKCGIPLAKKTGPHSYEMMKFHAGKKVLIEQDIPNGMVRCPICKRGFAHITVTERLSTADRVSISGKPVVE